MPSGPQTTVADIGDSRVRVEVRIPADEVERRLNERATALGKELRLPGFRRGHVPAPLVLQRVGREAVLEQAVRDSLSGWYAAAISESGILPVGDPKIELGELPAAGEPLGFSVEIGVLPVAELGTYKGLEVPRREATADEQHVEREIERVRERLARLETAERAAEENDFVVIDYVGRLREDGELEPPFEGGTGRDQLIELGAGNLIPGMEEGLVGASAGESRTLELSFPAEYGAEQLAGRDASFDVTVKEVKQRILPELDDDFAADAGFENMDELRADVRERLQAADEERAKSEFRQAALEAAVGAATVPLTDELVAGRAQEMWDRTLHALAHRGVTREGYLKLIGRGEEDVLAELREEAALSLQREAVVTAIVAAEQIAPGEDELAEALEPTAAQEGVTPAALVERLRDAGRLQEALDDLAARMAIDLICEQATPISPGRAEARERIWTPEERESEGDSKKSGELWTPDR
ncbi:MAG TPA: trigger factor [Solirubrobacteraceae bacterium]|nr:trigger factor [Solirubrobacteraceae bacterium]